MTGEQYDKLVDEVLQFKSSTKMIIIYGYHYWLSTF